MRDREPKATDSCPTWDKKRAKGRMNSCPTWDTNLGDGRRVLGLILVLVIALMAPARAAVGVAGAGKGAGPRLGPITKVEINLTSHAELERLVREGYDIDTVQAGRVVLYADHEELDALRAGGWEPQVIKPPAAGAGPFPKGLGAYNNYADLTALLESYATNHPSICRLVSLGQSVQQRELWALKITRDPDLAADKPRVKYVSTIHGNEPLGTEMCLYLIDHLLTGYAGNDPGVVHLVDDVEIWIVPLMNPDGRESNPPQRYNANGYDPNRSFPEGSAQNLGNALYGPPPATNNLQPEVRSIVTWTAARSFTLSANFHTGSLVVNYPYDNDGQGSVYSPTPDELLVQAVSRTYASNNPPMWNNNLAPFAHGVVNGAAWYSIAGGMQDWNYRYDGCLEVTIELSNSQWPDPPASELPVYWSDNRESMLAYLEWSLKGLRGVLRDAQTGQPVRGTVRVEGVHHLVFSDAEFGDYHRLLLPGTYTVWFYAPGYVSQRIPNVTVGTGPATRLDVPLQPVSPRFAIQVNFQPAGVVLPTGLRADSGAAFGSRAGAYAYGWETNLSSTNVVRRNAGRSQDLRYDSFCRMLAGGDHAWELAVPNGPYAVLLAAGDPSAPVGPCRITAEGVALLDATPSTNDLWVEGLGTVIVTDGRLTVTSAPGATGNALDFLEVSALEPSTIAQWRALYFGTTDGVGDAADTADPDHDGLANLLEYALGLDPTQPDAGPVLTARVVQADGLDWLACDFTRNTNATDLVLSVEGAVALPAPAWSEVATFTSTNGWSGPGLAIETTGEPNRVQVRVRDAAPLNASASRFLRVRVARD